MAKSMDSGKGGIDLITIRTIRECLEKQFVDVKFSQNIRPTFIFASGVGKLSWHPVINEEFLAGRMSIESCGDSSKIRSSRRSMRIPVSEFRFRSMGTSPSKRKTYRSVSAAGQMSQSVGHSRMVSPLEEGLAAEGEVVR